MESVAKITYELRGIPVLARRRAGFLIKEILERNAQKINSTLDPDRSFWMYAGHSSIIAQILNGLGFSEVEFNSYLVLLLFNAHNFGLS